MDREYKSAHDKAVAELENAKKIQVDFKTKFKNYLGPGMYSPRLIIRGQQVTRYLPFRRR